MSGTTPTPTPAAPVAGRIAEIIGGLAQANVAIPIITGTIISIIGIVKALNGPELELADLTAQIDAAVKANQARGEAEIARLKAKLQAQQGG